MTKRRTSRQGKGVHRDTVHANDHVASMAAAKSAASDLQKQLEEFGPPIPEFERLAMRHLRRILGGPDWFARAEALLSQLDQQRRRRGREQRKAKSGKYNDARTGVGRQRNAARRSAMLEVYAKEHYLLTMENALKAMRANPELLYEFEGAVGFEAWKQYQPTSYQVSKRLASSRIGLLVNGEPQSVSVGADAWRKLYDEWQSRATDFEVLLKKNKPR